MAKTARKHIVKNYARLLSEIYVLMGIFCNPINPIISHYLL